MKQEIYCNACGNPFEITAKSIKVRMSQDVEFRFFKCPSCDAAFLISAADKHYRQMIAKKEYQGVIGRKKAIEMSRQQKEKYLPRFAELVPTAYIGKSVPTSINQRSDIDGI